MSDVLKPLKQFHKNYINLLKFYKEFSSHFVVERDNLKTSLFYFNQIKNLMKILQVVLSKIDHSEENLSEILALFGMGEIDTNNLSDSEFITELINPLCEEMQLSSEQTKALGEMYKNAFLNSEIFGSEGDFDIEKFMNLSSTFWVNVTSPEGSSDISTEKAKNFDDFIKEAIDESTEKEKNLLNRLWSVCIVQLYTIFESFLKDLFIEIANDDPLSFFSGPYFQDYNIPYHEHILSASNREEIIDRVIEDSVDNYQKWYVAESFFKSKNIIMFPTTKQLKNREQIVWKEDLKVDPTYTVRQKLQKLHLYRNAITHNGNEVRDKDLKRAKVDFMKPHKVVLNENYIRHAFILINCIIRQIYSQLDLLFKNDESEKSPKNK